MLYQSWIPLKVRSTALNIGTVICPHLDVGTPQRSLVPFIAIQHQTQNSLAKYTGRKQELHKAEKFI